MSIFVRCDMDDCSNMDINYRKKIYSVSKRARVVLEDHSIDHCCQDCWDSYVETDYPQLETSKRDFTDIIQERGEEE